VSSWDAGASTAAYNAMAPSTTSSAGSRRRARRAQNPGRLMRPFRPHSVSSSDVMRKPDSTKNASTPRNPPGAHPAPKWYAMTAATANARKPSSAGW